MKVFIVILCLQIAACDSSRSCLSCSAVEGTAGCSHLTSCNDNEVCYTHGYTTESGRLLFDFGCSVKHVCPSPVDVFVGRRAEGHHTTCFECCNDTNICNQNIHCNSPSTASELPFLCECKERQLWVDIDTMYEVADVIRNVVNFTGRGPPEVYEAIQMSMDKINRPCTTNLPKECSDIKPKISGVYTIYPFQIQERPVDVHCIVDASSHIWTVIQQRANSSVEFYRDWDSYKRGFGSPHGNYWLGNDVIHAMTSSENHELMIKMSDFDAVEKYAEYQIVHVGDESSGYKLSVSGYTGNAGDHLSILAGSKFSTYDHDTSNMAVLYKGAWWFKDYGSFYCDLNGEYLSGKHVHSYRGIYWSSFKGGDYSLRSTLMMIRKTTM